MIPRFLAAGKGWIEVLAVPAIVVLVAIAAFGLGRLSVLETEQPHLLIYQPGDANASQASSTVQ